MSDNNNQIKNKILELENRISAINSDVNDIIDNANIKTISTEILENNINEDSEANVLEDLNEYMMELNDIQNTLSELEKQSISNALKAKVLELHMRVLTINADLKDFTNTINYQISSDEVSIIHEEQLTVLNEMKVVKKDLEKSDKRSIETITIFTAIIAIIVSVVVTSSTWLNNANTNTAIIAFIIPSLVVITSIIVLISFTGYMFPVEERKSKISGIIFIITLIAIIIFAVFVLPDFLKQKEQKEAHSYIYFSEEQYEIIVYEDIQYIKFKYNENVYNLKFNERYILNNNNICFCVTHNQLELYE